MNSCEKKTQQAKHWAEIGILPSWNEVKYLVKYAYFTKLVPDI